MNDLSFLSRQERASLALRELYAKNGYAPYKMSRFEPYDLYAQNRSFVAGDRILTFTDTNGRLMAMKPDVTLSIVKHYRGGEVRALYNESVYRESRDLGEFREIMQIGVERIGTIGPDDESEVLRLAQASLEQLGGEHILDVGSAELVLGLMEATGAGVDVSARLLRAVNGRNPGLCAGICEAAGVTGAAAQAWLLLSTLYGPPEDVLSRLKEAALNGRMAAAAEHLARAARSAGPVYIDHSIVTDLNYYNGLVFKGYVKGAHAAVLSGGRYDNLVRKLGKNAGAIGFAVYLDEIALEESAPASVSVALPKGRLGEDAYGIFEKAGFGCPGIREKTRKLIFENPEKKIRFFWVKPADVAIYVARGAADIGVVGSDVLREHEPDVYELLDLKIGKCRMCVAGMGEREDDGSRPLRVATKYPNTAAAYYAGLSREIDVIRLTGSIELAPVLALSDVIVDIVETGNTLRENGLRELETISPVTARLIANKAGYKFKNAAIGRIREAVAAACGEEEAQR